MKQITKKNTAYCKKYRDNHPEVVDKIKEYRRIWAKDPFNKLKMNKYMRFYNLKKKMHKKLTKILHDKLNFIV